MNGQMNGETGEKSRDVHDSDLVSWLAFSVPACALIRTRALLCLPVLK